ncbi:MAG: YciI family protein [Flavisolibacter sp.]
MKEFALVFRNSMNGDGKPSPEQMQQMMTNWMNWMGSIAAQNKLADKGNRLSMSEAKTVKPGGVVTDGPYTEIKEFINGYIVVRTQTIEEAIEIANQCPILSSGGSVEVRKLVAADDNS